MEVKLPKDNLIPEPEITFKKDSLQTLSVKNKDGKVLASISGYGLECGFDYSCIKTRESIEATASAIAELLVNVMIDTSIEQANKANNQGENSDTE